MSAPYAYSAQQWNHRGYWPWIMVQQMQPPAITIPSAQKDQAYHVKRARFYISTQNPYFANWMRACYATNLYFDRGGFGLEEDVNTFLMDKGLPTSRKALVHPILAPMKQRLVGQADGVSVSAQLLATTQQAVSRKETSLMKTMLLAEAAQEGEMMQAAVGSNYGVPPNAEEAEAMHENLYQDHFIRAGNALMEAIAQRNELDKRRRPVAERLALSGLAAMHCSIHGQDLVWEVCEPNEVGWDSACVKPDFTDAQYVFTCPLMSVTAIGERWNASQGAMNILDSYARNIMNGYNGSWPQLSPRVFTVYWKDGEWVERGYVQNADGDIEFVTIGKEDPYTGKVQWTDKDLVEPPINDITLKWTDAEKKARKIRKWITNLRYCSFIPWEYMPGAYTEGKPYSESANAKSVKEYGITDLVFDYGVYPLQESDPDKVFDVKYPLKFSTWSYMAGYVLAPLTAAVSPQRVMNQVTSNMVWRMSKAGGKSVVLDRDAVAGSTMSEQQILMNLKEGDPISVKGAVVGSVANAVQQVDTGLANGDYQMWGVLDQLSRTAQNATGIYDQNYGAPGGQDQLVGTKQLQLQQAGIMMQPFYAALAELFEQVHQFNIQAGKQFYGRQPYLLSDMVGEEGVQTIMASTDMQIEQFRVKVALTPDAEKVRQITDNIILGQLMPTGLLDAQTAAALLGKSFPQDAYDAAAKFTKQAAQAAQAQAQQMAQQQQQAAVAQQQEALDAQQQGLYNGMLDAALKSDQVNTKAELPMRNAMADHLRPQEAPEPGVLM